MATLKEKIQDLLKSTASEEVKLVCESFLKETDGKDINPSDMVAESLFTNLKSYVDKDSKVGALLNERQGYEQSIMDIESKISRDAAQRLAESWDTNRRDKKISNVGNLIDNTLKAENINKASQAELIVEKLSGLSDETAKKFVDIAKMDSYSIKESISAIKSSPIASHPNLKYVITKFESALMENTPEYAVAQNFIAQVSPFKWDATVKNAINLVQESINSKAAELEVQNTIHNIKATDGKRFFTDVVARMNEWVYSENKNVHTLIKEMKNYMFNPHVKQLADKLMIMENSKGTQFNIPVKDSNCSVAKIYSPVLSATNGQVFKAGNNFYHSTENKFVKLSEQQINALPKDFAELCESFFNPNVKVVNENVVIYVGKSKFELTNDNRIFVNEKQIDASTLGSQLMFHTQQTIFRDSSNMANVVMNIYENLNNICEIDYGKAIYSNVFEGVGVFLFKKGDKIFVNKINAAMNENSFYKANGLQTVNLVKEFLSFNMSESLAEFLEGDYKTKALMEGELNSVLSNIQILESELDKIEKAILEDPSFADVKEIADAKTIIEHELNGLKSQWQEMNTELKQFETAKEEDETEEPEEIIEEPKEEEKEEGEEVEGEKEEGAEEGAEPEAVTVEKPEVTGGLVDTGLLGAEGNQAAATAIAGNDHIDANVAQAETEGGNVLDAGFAGAEGQQKSEVPGEDISNAIKQDVIATPVITPGEVAEVIPGEAAADEIPVAVTPAAGEAPTPAGDAAVVADVVANVDDNTAGEIPAEVKPEAEGTDVDPKEEEPKEEEVKESQISESIGVDSKVKDKVSGKVGKVTAVNDEMFSILFDDGETAERKLGDLEDADAEVEQNIEKNEEPVDGDAPAKNTSNEAADVDNAATGEEGKDTEEKEKEEGEDMFVKATITLDLGPFKAGDAVEIDAANYTSSGDDEPVKLKEPKDGVSEVPKKYLKVEDNAPAEGGDDVDAKVAAVLQQMQELETLLSDDNTKGSKAIEAAKEKLKKFAEALGKENKDDDKSEEEEEAK